MKDANWSGRGMFTPIQVSRVGTLQAKGVETEGDNLEVALRAKLSAVHSCLSSLISRISQSLTIHLDVSGSSCIAGDCRVSIALGHDIIPPPGTQKAEDS